MGSKTKYMERPLTPEERALIAMQQRYIGSLQPGIDKLVSTGTAMLDDVYNPDWKVLQQYTLGEIQKIRGEQALLAQGKLPQPYIDSKKAYFNDLYENTMGSQLSDMARRGVINSSRFSSVNNQTQKNIFNQMSKDYSNDMSLQKAFLQQRWDMAQAPYKLAEATHTNSLNAPLAYFNAARGQGGQVTGALSSMGQMNNGRGTFVQKSGPLDALAGIAAGAAKFMV